MVQKDVVRYFVFVDHGFLMCDVCRDVVLSRVGREREREEEVVVH